MLTVATEALPLTNVLSTALLLAGDMDTDAPALMYRLRNIA